MRVCVCVCCVSRLPFFQQAGLGLASLLVAGGATGSAAAPAFAQTGSAVEVMRLRFGDKLRRAAKMLDELQEDIANEVSREERGKGGGGGGDSVLRRVCTRQSSALVFLIVFSASFSAVNKINEAFWYPFELSAGCRYAPGQDASSPPVSFLPGAFWYAF